MVTKMVKKKEKDHLKSKKVDHLTFPVHKHTEIQPIVQV